MSAVKPSPAPVPRAPVDPVLEGVVRRGHRIRRQYRVGRVVILAALLQLAFALPLLATRVGDDDTQVRSASPVVRQEGTTSTEATTTTAAPETTTTAAPVATTTTLARATVATSSTVASQCRNSSDARCGPFRWDPAPAANGPAEATITYEPASPRAGEQVRFTLRGTDPDAPDLRWWTGLCVSGQPQQSDCSSTPSFASCDPHGPWTPPAQRAFAKVEPWNVTFSEPGTYQVSFSFQTQSHVCQKLDAYGSRGTRQIDVVVQPASETPSS
jgi:hypothetical protein